jgi:polyisoprenoid-binding protein YceI
MKTRSILTILTLGGLIFFNACTKEKEVEKIVYKNPYDTLKPPSIPGAINNVTGDWKFDKVHSNFNWKSEYYGDHAWLTGKFNNFDLKLEFDAANYEVTKISAWAQMSTYNTGEPGRDGPGKCGPGYVGVKYLDTNFTVDPTTDTAWFESTSTRVEPGPYGNKYIATGTFTFMGVSKTVDMVYSFTGITESTNSSGVVSEKAGFNGEFMFLCQSDYNVTSTSVADEMYVTVGANFTRTKP